MFHFHATVCYDNVGLVWIILTTVLFSLQLKSICWLYELANVNTFHNIIEKSVLIQDLFSRKVMVLH